MSHISSVSHYKLISEDTVIEMEAAINLAMSGGWELHGAISVCAVACTGEHERVIYSHSMVKISCEYTGPN